MRSSQKTAFGGILTALAVVVMFLGNVFPYTEYALPTIASFLTAVAALELGDKWAGMVYAAASLICLFIIANKEAAVLYVFFFGYYPLIKRLLESRLNRVAEWALKMTVFNAALIAAYVIIIYVFRIPFFEQEVFGKFAALAFLTAGNITFIIYDLALSKIIYVYILIWQPRLRRMFRIKK